MAALMVLSSDAREIIGLLVVAFGDDGSGVGVDDVVGAAARRQRAFQFIIDVPAVGFEGDRDAIRGKIPVSAGRVQSRDGQSLFPGHANTSATGFRHPGTAGSASATSPIRP